MASEKVTFGWSKAQTSLQMTITQMQLFPPSPRPPVAPGLPPRPSAGLALVPQTFLEPAFGTFLRSGCKTFPLFCFCLCFRNYALKSWHLSNLILLMKNSFLHFHIKWLLTTQENIQREFSSVEAGPWRHVGAVPGLDIFSSFIPVAKDTLNEYSLQK